MYMRPFSWLSEIHEHFLSNTVWQGTVGASSSLEAGRAVSMGALLGWAVQGLAARAGPTAPARNLGSSPSPEHWAPPWGQGHTEVRLGCQPTGGSQDKAWWGEPGSDTAPRWSSRATGMGMGRDGARGREEGQGPGQARAWLQSAQAETTPDSTGLNLLLSEKTERGASTELSWCTASRSATASCLSWPKPQQPHPHKPRCTQAPESIIIDVFVFCILLLQERAAANSYKSLQICDSSQNTKKEEQGYSNHVPLMWGQYMCTQIHSFKFQPHLRKKTITLKLISPPSFNS